MSQVNVNEPGPRPVREETVRPVGEENAGTVATRTLTWAVAAVVVIAALAIAFVYVLQNVHP